MNEIRKAGFVSQVGRVKWSAEAEGVEARRVTVSVSVVLVMLVTSDSSSDPSRDEWPLGRPSGPLKPAKEVLLAPRQSPWSVNTRRLHFCFFCLGCIGSRKVGAFYSLQ